MGICTEALRIILELSFIDDPEDVKDRWNIMTEHASRCKTCVVALEAFVKGTDTRIRTGAVADWDVDPLKFQRNLNTNLSRFGTQLRELSLEVEAESATKFGEDIEKEMVALPLKKRVHLLLLLLWASGKRGITAESIQGRARIMKLLFLMKMDAGLDRYVSDYYTFAPYKLGPFEKAVYDDLDALVERNIIERKPAKENQLGLGSRLLKELEREESIDFDRMKINAIYTLTDTGKKYAQAYAKGAEQVDTTILDNIRYIKSTWASQPLRRLLKYVYEKYAEYTTESQILEKVLASDE